MNMPDLHCQRTMDYADIWLDRRVCYEAEARENSADSLVKSVQTILYNEIVSQHFYELIIDSKPGCKCSNTEFPTSLM